MRERLKWYMMFLNGQGITPARAGKTYTAAHHIHGNRDHPRSCGKDAISLRFCPLQPGSPPLVRERHNGEWGTGTYRGITPARAGKTEIRQAPPRHHQDHPRSCGKDATLRLRPRARPGSPPLVRERRKMKRGTLHKMRITPARAGKTFGSQLSFHFKEDHPRSCGKDLRQPT